MQETFDWHKLALPALCSICFISIITAICFLNKNTRIIFCDVGQGDASYIRIRNNTDILIDTGPDNKVLTCLGKHMPFYDRTIEYIFISHPQSDHIGGLKYILEHYRVKSIYSTSYLSRSPYLTKLNTLIKSNHTKIRSLVAGNILDFHGDRIVVVWPKKEFMPQEIKNEEFNDYSLIVMFQEAKFKSLFTGDASAFSLLNMSKNDIKKLDILKFPHHGSKQGLESTFLRLADPLVTVISVGKNNSYGHPTKEVMDYLKAMKTKILRTDEKGDIVFRLH